MSDREIEIEHTSMEEIEFNDLLINKLEKNKFDISKITTAGLSLLNLFGIIQRREIKIKKGDSFKYELKMGGVRIETLSTLHEQKKDLHENFMVMLSVFERKGHMDDPIHGKAIFYIKGRIFNKIDSLVASREDFIYRMEKTISKLFI